MKLQTTDSDGLTLEIEPGHPTVVPVLVGSTLTVRPIGARLEQLELIDALDSDHLPTIGGPELLASRPGRFRIRVHAQSGETRDLSVCAIERAVLDRLPERQRNGDSLGAIRPEEVRRRILVSLATWAHGFDGTVRTLPSLAGHGA